MVKCNVCGKTFALAQLAANQTIPGHSELGILCSGSYSAPIIAVDLSPDQAKAIVAILAAFGANRSAVAAMVCDIASLTLRADWPFGHQTCLRLHEAYGKRFPRAADLDADSTDCQTHNR